MNFYDLLRNPRVYDFKSNFISLGRASVRQFLRTLPETKAPATVLDVGCGTGRHAEVWAGSYYGVDCDLDYISYAHNCHHGNFIVGEATALAFPDNTFDLVLAIGLCHHLPDHSVLETVAEMVRVAKNGSCVYIVDAVLPSVSNVLGYVLFMMDRGRYIRDIQTLCALLSLQGLELVHSNLPCSFPYQRAVFCLRKNAGLITNAL